MMSYGGLTENKATLVNIAKPKNYDSKGALFIFRQFLNPSYWDKPIMLRNNSMFKTHNRILLSGKVIYKKLGITKVYKLPMNISTIHIALHLKSCYVGCQNQEDRSENVLQCGKCMHKSDVATQL